MKSVCYLFAIALKNGAKENSGENAVENKKFFAVEERSWQLFAIVCYYARKRQFLSALDSQKRGWSRRTFDAPKKRKKLVKVFAIVFATIFSYSALLWFFSSEIREKPQYLVVSRLELLTGFEPVTSSLPRKCSTS